MCWYSSGLRPCEAMTSGVIRGSFMGRFCQKKGRLGGGLCKRQVDDLRVARQNDGAKTVAEPWATSAAGRAGLFAAAFGMMHLQHHRTVLALHLGVDGLELRLLIGRQDGVDLRLGRLMRGFDLFIDVA